MRVRRSHDATKLSRGPTIAGPKDQSRERAGLIPNGNGQERLLIIVSQTVRCQPRHHDSDLPINVMMGSQSLVFALARFYRTAEPPDGMMLIVQIFNPIPSFGFGSKTVDLIRCPVFRRTDNNIPAATVF